MKATFGKYFNKGVKTLDAPHIGYVVRETDDQIVIFGDGKIRYDIPISEIRITGKNVLIGLNLQDIEKKYKVDRDAPLPYREAHSTMDFNLRHRSCFIRRKIS